VNNSLYSSPISIIVSKQSAVNAGEKTKMFLLPSLGKDSNTSSVKGLSHLFVNLD